MPSHAGPSKLISIVITVAVVGLLIAFRLRRMTQARPLKLEWLWVLPAIYLVFALVLFVTLPPSGLGWAWAVAALAVGAALGWYRGSAMKITVDPETHALNQTASPLAMLFLLGLVAIRFGLRSVLTAEAGVLGLNTATITDAFIALALGLFGVARIEMFLRARRLLAEARAAKLATTFG